jgi:segregation and condensation protein A
VRTLEREEILKAMISQDMGEDIQYYTEILNEVEENINYPDVFSETVSKIFRMVLTGKLDPWSVNISEFKDLFFRERNENFEVAGILISSAWHVLYEKSMKMMMGAIDEPVEENYEELSDNTESYDIDDTTMDSMPDLNVPVFHREASRVTITEFLTVMKKVYKIREKKPEKDPDEYYDADLDDDIISRSNTDTIEQGIGETLARIGKYMNPFFVEDYWGNTKAERANFILYLLFLQKSGKVELYQEEPMGNIQVTKLF